MPSPDRDQTLRRTIAQDPFVTLSAATRWDEVGLWPCAWIHLPGAGEPPLVVAYRRRFTLEPSATVRAHVSADERYELFLDGRRIGRGSERGDPANWFYETYDIPLSAGPHVLVARVWSLGSLAECAQMSAHHGFLFAAEGEWLELMGTGVATWEAKRLTGCSFSPPVFPWGTGAGLHVDGRAFPWGFERGEGEGWQPAEVLEPAASRVGRFGVPPLHRLRPATLPPMLERGRTGGVVRLVAEVPGIDTQAIPVRAADHLAGERSWPALLQGDGPVTVPPQTRRRVIVDLQDYVCAYHEVVTSGGAGSLVRVLWAEALFDEPSVWAAKGNRDEIEGRYFAGVGDTFRPDGGAGRRFQGLWWQAGRYIELCVQTAGEPLTIDAFRLRETRYPLEMESAFEASDARLGRLAPILIRGMQMCAHETYMDCPYYERLMYAGDARLEMLTTYVMTRDDRLPRKALRMFDASHLPSGLTQARYPSREMQIIPPFALWWVAMVRDYALWRDDPQLVQELMPGLHSVIEGYRRFISDDGLVRAPEGWNVMDWVPEWAGGVPPDGAAGACGLINWQFVYTLVLVADLEARLGEAARAQRARSAASAAAARAAEAFWDEGRGLFADDLAKQHFSEHTQCMALLSGLLEPPRAARVGGALLQDGSLSRATIYFSHYLFEACRQLGRVDALLGRLGDWFGLEAAGLKTPLEKPEPSRSDCHAWGAHPLYHYFASILGIRPGSLGFRTVEIAPQLGPLTHARGRLVHPRGEVAVDLRAQDGVLHGSIELPEGITGELRTGKQTLPLIGGRQEF